MQLSLPGAYFLYLFVSNRTYGISLYIYIYNIIYNMYTIYIYIYIFAIPSIWDSCNGGVHGMSEQSSCMGSND